MSQITYVKDNREIRYKDLTQEEKDSIHVNVGGVWKDVDVTDPPGGNISSSWKDIIKGWVRVGGAWKEMYIKHDPVPSNMYILYKDAGDVPGTATTVGTYNGYYPVPQTASLLSTGGTSTHVSSSHGNNSVTYTSYRNHSILAWRRTVGSSGWYTSNSSHRHTFSHSHPNSEYHTPPCADVLPTHSALYVNTGAVFFYESATPPSGWSNWTTYNGRYVRLRNAIANDANYASHGLDSQSLSTSTYTPSNVQDSYLRSVYYYRHYHAATHSHAAITNDYSRWSLNPVICPSAMYLDELPSGVIAMFTTAIAPTGWTAITDKNDRIIKMDNANPNTTGGTSTHSHASTSFTTGTVTNNATYEYQDDNYEQYVGSSSSHTFSHGHTTALSWQPPVVNFYFAKKN